MVKNQWWNNKDQTDKIKCGGSTLQDHEKQGIQPPISSQNQIDTMYIYINQRLTHIWNTHMFVDHVPWMSRYIIYIYTYPKLVRWYNIQIGIYIYTHIYPVQESFQYSPAEDCWDAIFCPCDDQKFADQQPMVGSAGSMVNKSRRNRDTNQNL